VKINCDAPVERFTMLVWYCGKENFCAFYLTCLWREMVKAIYLGPESSLVSSQDQMCVHPSRYFRLVNASVSCLSVCEILMWECLLPAFICLPYAQLRPVFLLCARIVEVSVLVRAFRLLVYSWCLLNKCVEV